jgi:rhomboid domain-containing protein 1
MLPPVSLAVMALNIIVYIELEFHDISYPSLDKVCLSAYSILYHKQWLRLILAPFFHVDDWHLYYNMISFSIKGRSLEKRYGSGYFAVLILVFSVSCSLVLVGLEYTSYKFLGRENDLTSCAVGFSGTRSFQVKNTFENI